MKNRFENWKPPRFDKNGMTKWHWKCQHHEKLKIGKHVDVGAFTYINAKHKVELQDNVQVGSHCSLYTVSTIDNKKGKILIKRNSKIGTHSVVMPGVTIGENSIIGAFSFVNRDIPPNSLAYGVPIKVIRKLTNKDKKL
ncbi:MAG: acyltransferase [Candidatus Omnitrophota bacterium]|nr:acyltransferase [Candidatus Omnitrophota bacterium]